MHVPKSAGSSITQALLEALPPGAVSSLHHDESNLCNFTDFEALPDSLRRILVVDERDVQRLAEADVVVGHFSLPLLRRVAPLHAITTILREPRARLLSLYAYWAVEDLSAFHPYDAYLHASQPLGEFLLDPFVAPVADNQVCRMLLHGDPRIPADGFIPGALEDELADECVALLDGFAFVGIQERAAAAWAGLSRFFGVELTPRRVNATRDKRGRPRCPSVRESVTLDAFAALEARTAIDRRIYETFLRRDTRERTQARRLADTAYQRQLIEIGAVLGA